MFQPTNQYTITWIIPNWMESHNPFMFQTTNKMMNVLNVGL